MNTIPPYHLRRHPRAKHLRIRISRDRQITVSMPSRWPKNLAEQAIVTKADWIRTVLAGLPIQNTVTASERHELTNKARILVRRLVQEYSDRYGFRVGKISIRHQRTRWGSCTEKGNMSFNARMSTLPENLQRYIVVHELVHTKEHNHSSKFWSIVESILPDYRTLRASLRNQSLV